MDGGKKIFRLRDMLSMPRGIEMKEFVQADGSITFIGQYVNHQSTGPNDKPKRTYCISLVREITQSEPRPTDRWNAYVFEDRTPLIRLEGCASKWQCAFAALGALRGILYRYCVCTNGNKKRRRREAAAAKNPVNPVNPVSKNKEA